MPKTRVPATIASRREPAPSTVKVADYVAAVLAAEGVTQVFEVVGGMITHLIDAIHHRGETQLVSMHHEQGAGFAAEGAGRMTGIPGVAMATSGPGATNLLTAIGSCYFDSSPTVFITGQVNRHEQRGDRPIRQLGFQETDIVAMAAPITKWAVRIMEEDEITTVLPAAFRLAASGRPGPVLVDIPMDLQRVQVSAPPPGAGTPDPIEELDRTPAPQILEALASARRPLILAGGGIRSARSVEAFRGLIERLGVPVVHSLMGVDLLPHHHPLRVGMIGSYGNRWANAALGLSDLLLVLGSRLDVRQTGSETQAFKGERTIFHVDCEPGEINNRVIDCHPVHAELGAFLRAMNDAYAGRPAAGPTGWLAEIQNLRARWPDTEELVGIAGINPNVFMHELSSASRDAAAYAVDVGQHQMWAAQSLDLTAGQRFLTSGGMGAMGFALPAAIGASLASKAQPVVVIAGDGAFQLNIQELQTIARNSLPIKVVVINNGCHGMVRQFQQSYFGERYQSTLWGYSAPDFTRIAEAYGIGAATVSSPGEVRAGLERMWANPAQPFLLQVMIDTHANVYPKLAFGHPITEMEPFVKPIAMEST